ncbi:hypothetical protein VNO77_19207 [Canavalia gladiata]|uniref:Uncharacterized protein n=1 Tax=Canavalia gladiata TaxID=3824 RepID=A0AAN9LQJ7_CANGL
MGIKGRKSVFWGRFSRGNIDRFLPSIPSLRGGGLDFRRAKELPLKVQIQSHTRRIHSMQALASSSMSIRLARRVGGVV